MYCDNVSPRLKIPPRLRKRSQELRERQSTFTDSVASHFIQLPKMNNFVINLFSIKGKAKVQKKKCFKIIFL